MILSGKNDLQNLSFILLLGQLMMKLGNNCLRTTDYSLLSLLLMSFLYIAKCVAAVLTRSPLKAILISKELTCIQ